MLYSALKIPAILLFITCHVSVAAQVINADTVKASSHLIVTSNAEVLRTLEELPQDSVISEHFINKFEPGKNKAIVFQDYNPYYYWFRFQFKNDHNIPKELILLMPPFGLKNGKLYQKHGSKWDVVAETGYGYPFDKRNYQYAHYTFPFTLPPHSLDTLYLSVDASKAYKSYAFALMERQSLKLLQNKFYFSFGIIIGLLTLFAIFNLYLNFIYGDKIHLWYALYIGILILIVMKHDQLDQEFLGWDSATAYRMLSAIGLGALAIGVLMHVVHQFLGKFLPHYVYKTSLFLKYNVLLSGISQIIIFYLGPHHDIQNAVFYWSNWSLRISILAIIINCIISLYKGYKVALFILAGLLVFLIGSLERILLTGSNTYLFPPTLFHIGMVLEILIISFGLFYRYKIERRERYANQKEKEKIKNSFNEELLKSKIEIQEQTLKTTFREIDQNIGLSINILKDNLHNLKSGKVTNVEGYVDSSNKLLAKIISDIRSLCKTLDTDHIRDIGLLNSIEYELELCRNAGDCHISLNVNGTAYRIDPRKELIIYRIYQAIINKASKQSANKDISVVLDYLPDAFKLIISYEGHIFYKNDAEQDAGSNTEVLEIYNRAALIGASFEIDEKHNKNTITLTLPYDNRHLETSFII